MFKDTPKGLLEAVLAINKQSREKFLEEQKRLAAKKGALGTMPAPAEGRADPAAHPGAHKMAEELSGNQHKLDVAAPKGKLTAADFKKLRAARSNWPKVEKGPQPRGGAGVKAGRAYGGAMQKEEAEQVDEAQLKPGESAPGVKGIWPGTEPKSRVAGEKQIKPGMKSIMIKGRGYDKPTNARLAPDAIPGSATLKTTSTAAGHSPIGARLVAAQASSRQPDSMQASDAENWKKRMGTYPRVVRGKSGKAAMKDTSLDDLHNSYTFEQKDTPGNGYTHQCALHVKSEQYGEGRTLTSQHAEPDAQGHIAWYDVMFAEGIVRMNAADLEVLVSESHGNHKKMKK